MLREWLKKSGRGILLAACLLLAWSSISIRALDENTQASSPPAVLSGDQIWMSSIPFGLKVYVMPMDTAPGKKDEEGYVQVKETHDIFQPKNLKGTTPFFLKGLPKGWVMIGVKPVTWLTRELESIGADPTFDCICFVTPLAKSMTSWIDDYRKGIGELDGGVVYAIDNDPQKRRYITILVTDKSSDLAEIEKKYPEDNHFFFDDTAAMETLNEKLGDTGVFSAEEKTKALSMAHRGGKVVVTKGDVRIVLDVEDHGKFTAMLLVNVPKK
jgi:hypothetical protein